MQKRTSLSGIKQDSRVRFVVNNFFWGEFNAGCIFVCILCYKFDRKLIYL
jgi:hypothetical protein